MGFGKYDFLKCVQGFALDSFQRLLYFFQTEQRTDVLIHDFVSGIGTAFFHFIFIFGMSSPLGGTWRLNIELSSFNVANFSSLNLLNVVSILNWKKISTKIIFLC